VQLIAHLRLACGVCLLRQLFGTLIRHARSHPRSPIPLPVTVVLSTPPPLPMPPPRLACALPPPVRGAPLAAGPLAPIARPADREPGPAPDAVARSQLVAHAILRAKSRQRASPGPSSPSRRPRPSPAGATWLQPSRSRLTLSARSVLRP